MFEPAAISLTSAMNPAAIPANAVMLENAGSPGDPSEAAQTGGFEALLALQSAQSQIMPPTNRTPMPIMAKLAAAAMAQAATGKTLPDAAMPLAAFDGEMAETSDDRGDEGIGEVPFALEFMADPAVIASIFAAPDRLRLMPVENAPSTDAPQTPGKLTLEQVPTAPKTPTTSPATAAVVAMAQAAVIELAPPAEPVLTDNPSVAATAMANVAASLQARPASSARASATPGEPATGQPIAMAAPSPFQTTVDDVPVPDIAQDIASPMIMQAADVAPMQEAAPAGRAEPRAERVDFATLVETLNRAREDASPNTVRVSLSHSDFGRVSMRFDQDDKGLSVSMSSADPGFARAVTASNEAASTATSSDTQRGQSSQTSNGGNAQGDGNRQSQGQRPDSPERPAAQLRDTLRRKDEPGSSSGIFA